VVQHPRPNLQAAHVERSAGAHTLARPSASTS
jgi:hypothetical protein